MSKAEIARARDELGVERNHCLMVENSFAATLEEVVDKKVAEAVELTCIHAKEERERAIKVEVTEYLACDAFQVVKVGCFLDGFKAFHEIAVKVFLDRDFSTFVPNEEEEGVEEGKEGEEKAE